jgi:hypothetical protein
MDGRVQVPVIEYLKTKFNVDYVDMITEAGPIFPLSKNGKNSIAESIRKRVDVSILKHRSQHLALVAHHDCAGNPVGKEAQIQQVRLAKKNVATWDLGVQIIGLWVDKNREVIEVG